MTTQPTIAGAEAAGAAEPAADVVLASVVKLALMPVIARAVAYYLFRVEGTALLVALLLG